MKKLIIALLVLSPFLAKAEVPAGTLLLGDGKGYNVQGTQVSQCLMDNNCYDMQGKFVFKRVVLGVSIIAPLEPVPVVMDNGTVKCQVGGTGNHNMSVACLNTRKDLVVARKLTFSVGTGAGATSLKVSTFGDKLGVQTMSAASKQSFTLDINVVVPSSSDYKSIAELDSTNLDIIPYTLTLEINSPFNTVNFLPTNDYSYTGIISAGN